jgi:hypothetical protein
MAEYFHLLEYIDPTDELPTHIQLWVCWPFKELFQSLSHLHKNTQA